VGLGVSAAVLSLWLCVRNQLVTGRVLDGACGIANARVRWRGASSFVTTDSKGTFSLNETGQSRRIVTAAKQGYFIAGQRLQIFPRIISLTPLPDHDNEEYRWVLSAPDARDPSRCGNCHQAIFDEWASSSHASAVNDRHFENVYDGTDWQRHANRGWNLLADNPEGAGVCNACHAPSARFDCDLRQLSGADAEGVHCDYCHKVAEAPVKDLGRAHGRYGLRTLRPSAGQLFFGPLDDADNGSDSYLPIYKESRYCASCHEGIVFGVPVYTTYSEWLESPARRQGQECQSCHMAPTGSLTNVAPGHQGIERNPYSLASHRFPGTTPEILARCLQMSASWKNTSSGIQVNVAITPRNVGHCVPTGFIDRQVLLVVEGIDNAGLPCSRISGPSLPVEVGPQLCGLAGCLYAKKLTSSSDGTPTPFWRSSGPVKDSRLRPEVSERSSFEFAADTKHIRIRLLYRRFWDSTAKDKHWPDNQILVAEQFLNRSDP
jgi:hypothetical protein